MAKKPTPHAARLDKFTERLKTVPPPNTGQVQVPMPEAEAKAKQEAEANKLTARVNAKVHADTLAALNELARTTGKSQGEIVREALADVLQKYRGRNSMT